MFKMPSHPGLQLSRESRRTVGRSGIGVGLYTPNYPGISREGGIGTYTKQLAGAMASLGHEIHVLTKGEQGHIKEGDVHVHSAPADYFPVIERLCLGSGATIRIGNAMSRLVNRFALDIVEFANWEGLALWFAARRSVPLVVRLHTSTRETVAIDRLELCRELRADIWREKASVAMADVIVTHSRAHRQVMASELGIDERRIHVVPHGILPAPAPAVQRDPKTVVYVGRLERRKGAIDVLHAAQIVIAQHPDVRFVLIGMDRPHCPGGRTHQQYLEDSFSPEVRQRVRLLGRLSDQEIDDWLQRATIFVAPSLYESFGMVFLEAMRWGTPVIGTDAGGIPEIVEHEKSGLLVSPSNPPALASAICRLLDNPALRSAIGEAGRQRCEGEFTAERMASRMAEIYVEAIERWRR